MTNTRSASKIFPACDLEVPDFNVTLNGSIYNNGPLFRETAEGLAASVAKMYRLGVVKVESISEWADWRS
jgi:hypothetical protein